MRLHTQRGELSLFWAAVLVAVVAAGGMAVLFAMRTDRNLLNEAAARLAPPAAGQALQQARALTASASEAAAIRRCTIDGKVVYSNVDCAASVPGSRTVELHDSHGIEAPKVPLAPAQAGTPSNLQEKLIEKATRN